MINDKIKEQLIIFKKVNVLGRNIFSSHTNVINSDRISDVLKNQGISRANLRNYIKENGVDKNVK